MARAVALFLLPLFAVGCSGEPESAGRAAPVTAPPAIPVFDSLSIAAPAPPFDVGGFNDRLRDFVAESRTVADLVAAAGDPQAVGRLLERVADAFSRIPEPPERRPSLRPRWEAARTVWVEFQADLVQMQVARQLWSMGERAAYRETVQALRSAGASRKAELTAIEQALTAPRPVS